MALKRVGLVSLHTSPLETPGSGDAGGMNVYVVALAEHLVKHQKLEVELITRASSPDHPEVAHTPGGVPVRFLRAGPPAPVPKDELPRHLHAFRDALRALPRYDLLHSHYWLSGAGALMVADEQHIPHVQSLHTVAALKNEHLAPGDHPEPYERLAAEERLVQYSARTIASTHEELQAIQRSYEPGHSRLSIVPPGVDLSLFHRPETVDGPRIFDWPAPVEEGRGRHGILVLARIQPLKGQDLAIRALATIPAERRPLLTIAGEATPGEKKYEKRLHALVAESGLQNDVVFVGTQTREQAAVLLREASLLIMPSHSETFGLVALEAAASGTPVVASGATGTATSVGRLAIGTLVPTREPADWGRAIDTLLADDAALATISWKAAQHARLHTWQLTADLTVVAYREAMGY